MPSINDESISDAIQRRKVLMADEGCLQARRLAFGVGTCFDDLLLTKLELDYLDGSTGVIDNPVPTDPVLPPTYLSPSCSFALSLNDDGYPQSSRNGRALLVPGYPYTADINVAFTQNDGGAATEFEVLRNGGSIDSQANSAFLNTPIENATTGLTTYSGRIDFDAGPIKNDSEGNPYPLGQIGAGNTECGNVQIEWDFPYFYGHTGAPGDPGEPSDLDDFANLTKETEFVSNNWNSISIPFSNLATPGYLWFAIPADKPIYQTWFESINNQGNIGGSGDFFQLYNTATIDIGGGNMQGYRIYISDNITVADGDYIIGT